MDVYAASEEGLGLAYIQPLSSTSGGVMLLYPSLADAALPQVYNHSIAQCWVDVFPCSFVCHCNRPTWFCCDTATMVPKQQGRILCVCVLSCLAC